MPGTRAGVTRLIDMGKYILVALVVITPIRLFVAQPFLVAGPSMAPTFTKHEYLVIDKMTYRTHTPERGDVIIFRYPLDPDIFFLKRVIGLPGERVEVNTGKVTIMHGSEVQVLDEPYAVANTNSAKAVTLGEDEYFVLGDNRSESVDSRIWGPLHTRYIIGRAYLRLFPFTRTGYLPGKHEF